MSETTETIYGCYSTHHWAHWPDDDDSESECGNTEHCLMSGTSVDDLRKRYNKSMEGQADSYRLSSDPKMDDDKTKLSHPGSTGGGHMHSSYTVEIREMEQAG